MAYNIDLRRKVINYIEKGNSIRKTSKIFEVSITAIQQWKKIKKETGSLNKKPLNRKPRVFHTEELEFYIKNNPTAYLQDIADAFGGSNSGAWDALNRLNINLKKLK